MNLPTVLRNTTIPLLCLAAVACAPGSYAVRMPEPTAIRYEAPPAGGTIAIIDERRPGDIFNSGILPAALTIDGKPLDPPAFLATTLTAELASRGIDARGQVGGQGIPRVRLLTFNMQNDRVSGFSPFITLTFLSADVETATGTRRIAAFVKRGKVPVWSFSEVIDPIFNDALTVVSREFATKVANVSYATRASDATVRELAARLDTRTPASFMDVYALGFTNNPSAIPKLVELLADSDEYVRLAAISSLGTIGATGEYARLKAIYENKDAIWQDRAMAIKAIGDLGTAEGKVFLQSEAKRLAGASASKDTSWTSQVIGLYL